MFKHVFLPRQELVAENINGHRYYATPDGLKYPSVTSVIGSNTNKSWLQEWRNRVGDETADRISRQAASRGTSLHNVLEKFLLNEDEEEFLKGHMPTTIISYTKVKPVLKKHIDTVFGVEHPLYSHRLRTAGRTDAIVIYDNVPSIVDFKTASNLKREEDIKGYFLQSTCYALMVGERYELSIPQIVIVIAVDHDEVLTFVKKTSDFVEEVVRMFKNHTIEISSK